MKNRPVPPSAIVVGLVRSGSRAALGWAVDEALATSRPLHVMHVLDGGDHTPVDLEGHVDVVTEAAVTGILEAHPSVRVSAHTDTGSAAAALVTASRSARTLVVGAATHGLLEAALLGSVALQVAAHSFCPVVVLHDRESDGETSEGGSAPTTREPGRVVVGLDASERSERALAFGFEQASRREVGLTAVACWTWEDSVGEVPGPLALGAWEDGRQQERRLVAELLAGWRGKYPDVDVRTHLVHARVVSTLLDVATDASLLVVGTRGRGGFDGLLLGSVSQRVLERASCPVAVVPAPDLDLGRAPR
ncbi:MAG: universal stress protein [Lapillicoccus sp.]